LEKPDDAEGISHLQQFCSQVETVDLHRLHPLQHIPGLIRYALEGKPLELKFLYSDELAEKIVRLVAARDFDIVQIEHARMALYLEALPKNRRSKTALMFHNFTYQQYGRVSQIEHRLDRKIRAKIDSLSMLYWEPRYAEKFDLCATVSEADRNLLLAANPRLNVEVIPNGVDVQNYQPLPGPGLAPSMLFIGNMGYPPSVDAVLYFCREIFPIILQQMPAAELWIVGRDPRAEVLQLNGKNIHVTGRVDMVVPYYQQSSICVVPLRAGGGTRLKILEAMAIGRPVVSTTIGCEGLDVIDGEHLLIADTPSQFAEKALRLLNDRQLYQYLSVNGRKLVEARYDWDKIAERLVDVYAAMVRIRR
jgi:glycosyltransferase involved in cell wall biosynthesis